MISHNHQILKNFNLSENKFEFFKTLSDIEKSRLLYLVSDRDKKFLISKLSLKEFIDLLKYLDPVEIVDILQILSKRKQKVILNSLNKDYKKKVNFLLKFAPDSAAGIMSLDYIIVKISDTKKEILERIKEFKEKRNKDPIIIVEDEYNHIIGELPISNLLLEDSKNIFRNLKKIQSVYYNEDQENVIEVFKKNPSHFVVVLDEENRVIGIVFAKGIIKALEEENTEDYYGLAGLDKQEDILDKPFFKVKFRLSWLIVNLATAFLAAWTVSLFEGTISKFVLLAAFMPIVAGMGGNAATQSSALVIRSLALNKVYNTQIFKIVFYEIIGGIINGIIIGLIVLVVIIVFYNNLKIGILTAVAIVLNMIVAAIFGTLVPIILNALGVDPASSSTVFVTTATDVLGFFMFLGLASLFLM